MKTRKCVSYLDESAPGFLLEYRGDFNGQIEKVDYACGETLTDILAVVSVSELDLDRLRWDVPAIKFIDARSVYTLQEVSSSQVDKISELKVNPYLDLTGYGVVVGIVDTGVNYTNEEFIREDGTSRILWLWDQTLEVKKEPHAYIGSIYSNNEINRALEVKRQGGNPYDIVPSKDEIGHGTEMAGVIGAGGYNSQVTGIANDCDFLVVKLLESPNYKKTLRENNLPEVPVYNNTEVLSAIEFLRITANRLNRPLVIYIGVGSNDGSHDGYDIMSSYITSLTNRGRIVFTGGTGNQGNSEIHTSNFLQNSGEVDVVELLVPQEMKEFNLYIWVQKPNRMSLSIISPTGEETGYFSNQIYTSINRNFYYINTSIIVRIYDPEYLTGHQLFNIRFNNIKPGIWKLKLRGELIFDGRYDIWLNNKELLPKGMKFLRPVAETTLAVPSTARNLISVSYYDGKRGAVLGESGKGFNVNGTVKPDLATVGTDVITTSKDGTQTVKVEGSSVATAITAGVAALFLQWAIINKNDVTISSNKLRSILTYGADREDNIPYPNEYWGYGKLNAVEVFNILSGSYRRANTYGGFYEESFNNLYFRMPISMANQAFQQIYAREQKEGTGDLRVNKHDIYNSMDYGHYAVQYYGTYSDQLDFPPNIYVTKIDDSYAIVSISLNLLKRQEDVVEVSRLLNKYINNPDFGISYVQFPDLYSLQDISAVESAKINPIQAKIPLDLTGKDVVVGIIDTGIDYLNEEFQGEDGKTRILEIWDQTLKGEGDLRKEAPFGKLYSSEDINRAIERKNLGGNPYDIVESKDLVGHGTNMAGVIGGRGKNPDLKGIAPRCQYVVVKMVEALAFKEYNGYDNRIKAYNSMAIISALNYLKAYALREEKPLVILLPLGTTNGNHKGEHFLDAYIESISKNVGIIVVTGTGNEGSNDGHVSGIIEAKGENKDIDMVIGQRHKIFYVSLWIDVPNIVDLTLISPSGQSTGLIRAVMNQSEYYTFILEESKVYVYFYLPEKFSGDQLIRLYFYNIDPGTWRIRLKGQRGKNIKYNGWMWQKEFVGEGTRFTPSDPYGTITIPGDSDYIVSVAAFNQNNGNLLSYSGVALIDNYLGKVDFAAGGVNTITVGLDNSIAVINGTSLSAAIGAGICALLLEWGIVKENYPYMYSQSIKTFLRRGTIHRRGDTYPNQQLGFGIINLYKIFEEMS